MEFIIWAERQLENKSKPSRGIMIACSDKFFLMYILLTYYYLQIQIHIYSVPYDLNIMVDNENNLNSKYVIIS